MAAPLSWPCQCCSRIATFASVARLQCTQWHGGMDSCSGWQANNALAVQVQLGNADSSYSRLKLWGSWVLSNKGSGEAASGKA